MRLSNLTENNLKPKTPRRIFLAFIDLDLRGTWQRKLNPLDHYTSEGNEDEIWLVSPDQLKRAMIVKTGTDIYIVGSTLMMDQSFIVEEISIDEKEQQNRSLTKSWY